MKVERNKLEEKLNIVLDEICTDSRVVESVKEELISRNIFNAQKILGKNIPLQVLDLELLCILASELYKYVHD